MNTNNDIRTRRQRHKTRILQMIQGRASSKEAMPTIKELQEATGLKSSASIHEILNELEKEKKITRIPNISRGIQLVDQASNG